MSVEGPAATRSVVIHGHFYQPPREDPWTGRMPRESSASPWHDWNRRVHDECYGPVTAARILGPDARIARLVNTLEWISFDVGATLMRWLAKEEPATYQAVLAGDRASRARLGHGNAMASPYHHIILPLASRRDKVTEVRWGMDDFRRRFGREPEGMWLPEAAVDLETLEVLAAEGIRFTILGPDQVVRPPERGLPARVPLGGSKEIAVFVYDGSLSHDIAFGRVLPSADDWAARLTAPEATASLTLTATDGETFGHHHRWGDLALAAVIERLATHGGARLENPASFLARHPPRGELEIVEPSSWSCAHGVERWRAECGCKMAPHLDTQQRWRSVLREALDDLAEAVHGVFEERACAFLQRPWEARDEYASVRDEADGRRRDWLRSHGRGVLSHADVDEALRLLEMEWDALRMFTSCGWFFDDLAGLEPLQVLRYAARAIDGMTDRGAAAEASLVDRLSEAESNDPTVGDGATLWRERVRVSPDAPSDPGRQDHLSVEVTAATASAGTPDPRRIQRAALRVREAVAAHERIPDAARAIVWQALWRAEPGERELLRPLAEALGFSATVDPVPLRAHEPLRFVFGLHLHQPVGNFDAVFRDHTELVYEPFLAALEDRGALPVTVHVSGPLLDWLERAGHAFLDRLGRLAADGRIEMLLSGFWEPVLSALDPADRAEQIAWMRTWLRSRFGVEPRGLWLTERVWEQDLAKDLVDAGIEYAFVDDRHLGLVGRRGAATRSPVVTEHGGRRLTLLPIDERLRYLVPFRPPTELAAYLRRLGSEGATAAILADDGEKFGGWPGTRAWVWESGWLGEYLDTLEALSGTGVIRLVTARQAVDEVRGGGGPVYLPSASYREMEGWSLPPGAARSLAALSERLDGDPAARLLLRGGHWRNFLARYPESNRMHKKAQALSELCRASAAPPAGVRRAIGRAQCNDAYWHGVFGGLYLRHLRDAIWAELAEAEGLLRAGQGLEVSRVDADADGRKEILVHSGRFAAMVAPHRGGAVEELTLFGRRVNLANVLTRRREAYHVGGADGPHAPPESDDPDGLASIHDLEEGLGFERLPPFDRSPRSLLAERVLAADVTPDAYESAEASPIMDWTVEELRAEVVSDEGWVTIHLTHAGQGRLEKTLTFDPDGRLTARYRWDPGAFPDDAWFAPELSLGAAARVLPGPGAEEAWTYDIVTVSRSESGAEESVQGRSITPRWPVLAGAAEITLDVDAS